jgi:hypothetical protein
MRKSLLFLPILLLLTGCIDDQKQQEARCESDAVHQVSGDRVAFMLNCIEEIDEFRKVRREARTLWI